MRRSAPTYGVSAELISGIIAGGYDRMIKLKKRVISIVCDILECDEATATERLERNNWSIREAVSEANADTGDC